MTTIRLKFTDLRCHTAPLDHTCRERGASSAVQPTKETAHMSRRRQYAAVPPAGPTTPAARSGKEGRR
ncbi:hypothetical protein Slala02_58530 [Streptomyces lavendulae subsp. lavendulae]|nr:hypothetical protein Slala01_61940 [Streptomyces lavendulae subsp. lavendulae]GLX30033.1 hypothetical protein Slala02_58530 [Streptomyces lavendulae subsp. lavendulae]